MKTAIFIAAACGAAAITGLIALANELGRFSEEINPYQGFPADELEDESVERACYGCMGASFGDCNRCKEQKK